MADTLEQLANIPLFGDLPVKSLQRIERIATTRDYAEGDVIFDTGDEGVGVFLIVDGQVEVLRDGTSLAKLGAGDVFGEMALIDHYRRSATVRALAPTKTIMIPRWDFISEIRANPDIAVHLLQVMSRRLREVDERAAAL